MEKASLEKWAKDYSGYLKLDMEKKLEPLSSSLDDMFARLEEFQTMIYLAQQERIKATALLTNVLESNGDLSELFARIDACEQLVDHVKAHLEALERLVERAEDDFGVESATSRVANMFSPLLFKKSAEKKKVEPVATNLRTDAFFH